MQGEIAVVTGAGRGLGRALAKELAGRGVTVVGVVRSLPEPPESGPVHYVAADVSDPAAVAAAFAEIRERVGEPTILINNAAVYPHRDILDETPETLMGTIAVNLGGAINCCHAVLPGMVGRGQGRIVNVSSFADRSPAPMSAGYAVSKGALRIFTRALVSDLGDRFPGIVITDWIPGALKTGMGIPEGIDPADAARWGSTLALRRDRALNGMVFLENREHRVTPGLKGRLKNRLLSVPDPIRLD